MDHVTELDRLIGQHESHAQKIRAIKAIIGDDQSLIDELRTALFPPRAPTVATINLVLGFLRSKNNEWQTARQIAEGTGLRRGSINFILFTSAHKDQFETKMLGPKKKVWRLKVEAEVQAGPEPIKMRQRPKVATGDKKTA